MDRITIGQPAKYVGIEDLLPKELVEFGEELSRRLSVNHKEIQDSVGAYALGSATLPTGEAESSTEADARMALQLLT